MKKIGLILILTILLTACIGGNSSKDKSVVKVGLTGSDSKAWTYVKDQAAKEGIDVELVFFDSYSLPNAALSSGEIDINAFQHHSYFDSEIEQHGYELSVIGETVFAPLGLYSRQIKGIDELKDGDTIVIPDDVTNGGRALYLLEEANLIKVNAPEGKLPTVRDIENPRNFEILELAATNIPASLEEVPLAAINSGVATDAGFVPAEDSIVLEEGIAGDNPYINIIVARTEDKDNQIYTKIVDLYQSDKVKEIIEEDTKNSSLPVW